LATPPTPSINTRRASRSENTRHAYRAAGVRFTAWCAIHDQTVLQASSETIAAEGRSYFAVNTLRPHQAVMIRYLHLCRDQARAPSPVKEKTALVLDRPRSALLTIPDALAGLRDGHCSSSASPRHCGRARSPGSKHAKLCATRNGVEPYRPGASSIRTCAARRSTAGRSHRSLPGQCTRRLARGHGDQPSAPACPAGGEG
jgi:hypothetical protein